MNSSQCPFCKNNFTDEEIIQNTKFYKSENYQNIEGFDKNTYCVDMKCPNKDCGFEVSEAISGSDNSDNEFACKSYAIYYWKNKLQSKPEKDTCPSCGYKVDYNKDEFVYPAYIKDMADKKRTYKINCTSHDYSCCFSYFYKSELRKDELYSEAKEIWNKLYN